MYALNVWELWFMEKFQNTFSDASWYFTFVSNTIGNPNLVYTTFFPLLYGYDCKLAIKFVHAVVMGDWLNLIMKWILMGDRPYWWIHEAKLSDTIHIKQFYNTCETGPGNPSGHMAITGIAWYICIQALIDKVQIKYKKNIKIPAWTVYILSMFWLAASRVYISAHFPHQCVFGFAIAVLTGKLMTTVKLDHLKLKHYLYGCLFSIGSAIFLHKGLEAIGVDVNRTLALAHKWCDHPEWVHESTNPYYILWRFVGVIFGTGLIINTQIFEKLRGLSLPLSMQYTISMCGFIISNVGVKYAPKTIGNYMFLVVALYHTFLITLVGICVPTILDRLKLL